MTDLTFDPDIKLPIVATLKYNGSLNYVIEKNTLYY